MERQSYLKKTGCGNGILSQRTTFDAVDDVTTNRGPGHGVVAPARADAICLYDAA